MSFAFVLWMWRIAGIVLWPFLLLHPKARRHMLHVPLPTPNRSWVHGASLGEHRAVDAIAPHLGPCWITSSSWRTPVVCSFPAPLDLPFVIGPWLDRARPSRLVLVEAELWPGWIAGCKKRGIPITVVSGRKGKGYRRWQWLKSTFHQMMSEVQFLDASEWGDLKAIPSDQMGTISLPSKTIIGASTRAGDDPLLVNAWSQLDEPRPLLILAPRHLRRVPEIVSICQRFQPLLWSEIDTVPTSGILVLDTLGELERFMSTPHAVFIGGTRDACIGGHSPSSAAMAGAHILAGPHRQANPAAWHGLCVNTPGQNESWTDVLKHIIDTAPPPAQKHAIDIDRIVAQLPPPAHLSERTHRPWLRFLSPLWSGPSWLTRAGRASQPLPRPTIVVGGLVAGGAGRTPVVGWLADALPRTVVLSSGYKRSGKGNDTRRPSSSLNLGDELEMLHRRGHPVISAPRRIDGLTVAPVDGTVIIDGAFSDRRLNDAYRVAVIDAQRPTGGGPIPAGSQRLPWHELNRADAFWITHWADGFDLPALPANRPVVRSQLEPVAWLHRGETKPLSARQGEIDVAVGIATPERFVCTLLDLGFKIRSLHRVQDHGHLGTLKPGTVVTEKDAARLPIQADVWALKMAIKTQGTDALLNDIGARFA